MNLRQLMERLSKKDFRLVESVYRVESQIFLLQTNKPVIFLLTKVTMAAKLIKIFGSV